MKSFFEAYIWPKRGKLYRLVYLWVRDRSLAEDLLQNVFEKTFEREAELQHHPNLSGWLVKSLKNETLMHFRQNQKLDSIDGLENLKYEDSQPDDCTDAVKKVMGMIQILPVMQQEVFQLREVEGLEYQEIADYLEISLDQVKVNLHRARKSIRERMINQIRTK